MWKALVVATPLLAAAFVAGSVRADHPTELAAKIMSEFCGDDSPFMAETDAAMQHMMDGMKVNPTGDVDRDFTAMMIPHHQGAIEMAQAELRHGKNEQLRRIAQEIIVDQQQEIAAMHVALGQPLPRPVAAPDQAADLAMSAANAQSRPAAGGTMNHE